MIKSIVIYTIKMLKHPGDLPFHLSQAVTVQREIYVDFLYRFNDKYPFKKIDNDNLFCNSSQEGEMDVYDVIMDFLIPSGYFPSAALLKEYSQSETTKTLNIFPTIEYLNKKFERNIYYNRMKERYYFIKKY